MCYVPHFSIAMFSFFKLQITKLKIDCNPFAKGFRDSSRLTDFERWVPKSFPYTRKLTVKVMWCACTPDTDRAFNSCPYFAFALEQYYH